jgi:phospholipid transport system substrate-binding protein
LLVWALAWSPARADDAKDVRKVIESAVTAVLDVLKDAKLGREEKKAEVMGIVDPVIDFRLMAKLVLGREHWGSFTKPQQEQFTDLFVKQLRDSYFDKVDLLTDEKADFDAPEPTKDGKFQMMSHILSKGQRYKMLYKVYKRESAWKVYDIEIEGISLVRSYGAQYDEFLRGATPEALLKRMREKPMEGPKDLQRKEKEIKGRTAVDKSPETVESVKSE